MEEKLIADKTLSEWIKEYPILKDIVKGKEVFWHNPLDLRLATKDE